MGVLFWEKLLKDINDINEKVIVILKARGFLIDYYDGYYYLSDNADFKDLLYLIELNQIYNIIEIRYTNKNIKLNSVEEAELIDDLYGFYNYYDRTIGRFCPYKVKRIPDKTIQITVKSEASIEKAINLFYDLKRNGAESGNKSEMFISYYFNDLGPKVNLTQLESHIALYVKAISACGVRTYYCCDGNHHNGGSLYVYSNRPSNSWHRAIWDNVVSVKFGKSSFIEDHIYYTQDAKEECFYQIYLIANYLYENRQKIREVRRKTLAKFDKKYRRNKSEEELINKYEEVCKRLTYLDFNL